MLYVLNGKIYNERRLYLKLRKPIRKKLNNNELESLGVYLLQDDTIPLDDVYTALETATQDGNGLWHRDYDVRSYSAEELEDAKISAIKTINTFYQSKVDRITELYPEFEQSTWKWQYEEALALQADPQSPSPIIDKVVQWSDGFTKTQYVTYLINNMPIYLNIAGKHVGLLLDAKNAINNSTTRAEIEAIVNGVLAT